MSDFYFYFIYSSLILDLFLILERIVDIILFVLQYTTPTLYHLGQVHMSE